MPITYFSLPLKIIRICKYGINWTWVCFLFFDNIFKATISYLLFFIINAQFSFNIIGLQLYFTKLKRLNCRDAERYKWNNGLWHNKKLCKFLDGMIELKEAPTACSKNPTKHVKLHKVVAKVRQRNLAKSCKMECS